MWNVIAATPSHVAALAALEEGCFSHPWTKEGLLRAVEDPSCFVWCVCGGDEVLGYISGQWVLDEGYIHNLAVSPTVRRQGIARTLLSWTVDWAKEKGLRFLSLEVRVSNQPAIALYQRMGFRSEGIRRHFYQTPTEDAYVMTAWF